LENLGVGVRIILKLIVIGGLGGADLVNLVQDRDSCLTVKSVRNTLVAKNVVNSLAVRSYCSSLTRWIEFCEVSF